MNRQRLAQLALGTCSLLVGMFLARLALSGSTTSLGDAPITRARNVVERPERDYTHTFLEGVRRQPLADSGSASSRVLVALCQRCTASRALVRILLRRHRAGAPIRPMLIVVDRSWPQAEELVRRTANSTLITRPELTAKAAITPAALPPRHIPGSRHETARSAGELVVGVVDVVALLSTTPPHS